MLKINSNLVLIIALIFFCAFSRIIPHMANFSPLCAMALFGAATFNKKWHAFIIPLAATWLSDLFINNVIYAAYYPKFTWFYDGFYWQYGSYILISILGLGIFKNINFGKIVAGTLGSTIIFFLVSNLGCWIGNSFYSQNFSGLFTCYAAGLPFVKGTLLGNLFYTTLLFGSYNFLKNKFLQPIKVNITNAKN